MNDELRVQFVEMTLCRGTDINRAWLRTASLQYVKIMPDNVTGTKGGGGDGTKRRWYD